MILDIFLNVIALISLIFIFFLLLSFAYNVHLVHKHRIRLDSMDTQKRLEEIERIHKNQNKRFTFPLNKHILLNYFTHIDYKKAIIESRNNDGKTASSKPVLDSVFFSILIIVFTFFFIGSSFKTDLIMMQVLRDTTRMISILIGLFMTYKNSHFIYLLFKHKISLLNVFALLFNLLSIFYYCFVSYYAISEILF